MTVTKPTFTTIVIFNTEFHGNSTISLEVDTRSETRTEERILFPHEAFFLLFRKERLTLDALMP